MKVSLLLTALAALLTTDVVAGPTATRSSVSKKERRVPAGFAYAEGGDFKVNGKKFFFAGTNAYWLSQLNTEADIVKTLTDIANKGVKVVRTWGFREVVGTPPSNPATYTSLWQNGQRTFNQAGIDRLKFITNTAASLGIKIQFSLTNNWSPTFPDNFPRPPGYFSNSYGGVDTYVQQLVPGGTHDAFYTNEAVKNAYKDWLRFVVPSFANDAALFSWELANDPRCKGATGTTTSPSCNAQTITAWTAEMATFIKTLDGNHMAASGDAGFFCADCPKLFPFNPPPVVSGGSLTGRKRAPRRRGYLTKAHVLAMMKEDAKLARRSALAKAGVRGTKRIRGSWSAPATSYKLNRRQQDTSVGAAYDGSQGVDTEDISNIPSVDFTSFQLFPDQNNYSTSGADSSSGPPGGAGGNNFGDTVQQGLNWIQSHADSAQTFNKPTTLTGFGLVNQDSSGTFVPFDSTNIGTDSNQAVATDNQQATAYTDWTTQAVQSGINGIVQYQWGETGLTSQTNSVVDDSNHYGQSGTETQGSSPDDGYSAVSSAIQNIIANTANAQNSKSGQDSS
ncbi:hypothetical protein FRB99_001669 [Tulasnella sp. 403]|nr:hypothetical protein FRB99_001669 [Tulasnella sp. 403]